MKHLVIILLLSCAYVGGRAMPKIAEGAYQLERQREAQEFMLELKGVKVIRPKFHADKL